MTKKKKENSKNLFENNKKISEKFITRLYLNLFRFLIYIIIRRQILTVS